MRLGARRAEESAADGRSVDGRGFDESANGECRRDQERQGRKVTGHFRHAAKHATARTRAGGLGRIRMFARARRVRQVVLSLLFPLGNGGWGRALLRCAAVLAGGSRYVTWGASLGGAAGRIPAPTTGRRQRVVRDRRTVAGDERRQRDPGNQTYPPARHAEIQPLQEPTLETLRPPGRFALPVLYAYRSLPSTALTFSRKVGRVSRHELEFTQRAIPG